MDKKKILIVGAGNSGITDAVRLAAKQHDICVLHDVVDSQFTDLRDPEPFLITRLTEFKEPWIDPNEPIINYKKHQQTCAKNRKKKRRR
jgi:choline dehydrogenase-like flavoprotein